MDSIGKWAFILTATTRTASPSHQLATEIQLMFNPRLERQEETKREFAGMALKRIAALDVSLDAASSVIIDNAELAREAVEHLTQYLKGHAA